MAWEPSASGTDCVCRLLSPWPGRILYNYGVEHPVVAVYMQVGQRFQRTDMQMFPFKHIPAVPVGWFFAAQHLAQFGIVVGEVDEDSYINIPGADGVESVNNEELYLAEISVQLVNLFGDDVYAGD